MAHFDLPLAELEQYRPQILEPPDFDAFWEQTIESSRAANRGATFEPYDPLLPNLRVFDVTFSGFAGESVKGWFIVPTMSDGPVPCVVEYLGYNGGRGLPTERLLWSAAGYAHFVMDSRGQPAADTPDSAPAGLSPQAHGLMTRGIESPATYYYRRLMTDAVLALDAVAGRPEVDPTRIVVAGGSQGGGLALAVAGLDARPTALLCDVPFLCHYERAVALTEAAPYVEISRHLATRRDRVQDVLRVLSYFDGVSFAARARARALFSVALFDDVCPPSTVYAAYNRYAGPKEIRVYRYNHHEGGGALHDTVKLRYVHALAAEAREQR